MKDNVLITNSEMRPIVCIHFNRSLDKTETSLSKKGPFGVFNFRLATRTVKQIADILRNKNYRISQPRVPAHGCSGGLLIFAEEVTISTCIFALEEAGNASFEVRLWAQQSFRYRFRLMFKLLQQKQDEYRILYTVAEQIRDALSEDISIVNIGLSNLSDPHLQKGTVKT